MACAHNVNLGGVWGYGLIDPVHVVIMLSIRNDWC